MNTQQQKQEKQDQQEFKNGSNFGKTCFYAGLFSAGIALLIGSMIPLIIYTVCVVICLILNLMKKKQGATA